MELNYKLESFLYCIQIHYSKYIHLLTKDKPISLYFLFFEINNFRF